MFDNTFLNTLLLKWLNIIWCPADYCNTFDFPHEQFRKNISHPASKLAGNVERVAVGAWGYFGFRTSCRPIARWAHIPIIVMPSRINSREDVEGGVGGGGRGVKVMVAEQPKPPNRSGHVCNLIHSIPLLPPSLSFLVTVHPAPPSPLPSSFTLSHPSLDSFTMPVLLTYPLSLCLSD